MGVRRKYHERATKLAETQDTVRRLQDQVQSATIDVARLQAKLSAAVEAVKLQNARLTDNSTLVELKRQLRRLEGENQAFAVQEEVLRYYLAQKQLLRHDRLSLGHTTT